MNDKTMNIIAAATKTAAFVLAIVMMSIAFENIDAKAKEEQSDGTAAAGEMNRIIDARGNKAIHCPDPRIINLVRETLSSMESPSGEFYVKDAGTFRILTKQREWIIIQAGAGCVMIPLK
jgi:hypothetical protein